MSKFNSINLIILMLIVSIAVEILPFTSRAQSNNRIARWNPQRDIIAVSDGYTIELFTLNFTLVNTIPLFDKANRFVHVHSFDMVWSPDGKLLALHLTGSEIHPSNSHVVQIWDIDTAAKLTELTDIHSPAVYHSSIAWRPDSKALAAVHLRSYDYPAVNLNIYDAASGELLQDWMPDTAVPSIQQPVWNPNANNLVMVVDNQLQLWDTSLQRPVITLSEHPFSDVRPQYNPDGNFVAFVDRLTLYNIQIWSTDLPHHILTLQATSHYISRIVWSPKGIHSENYAGDILLWDVVSGEIISSFNIGTGFVQDWSPDGNRVLILDDNRLQIRDASTGEILASLDDPPDK